MMEAGLNTCSHSGSHQCAVAGRRLLSVLLALGSAACAPLQQKALATQAGPEAAFSDKWFTSFDGARLGLDVYPARAQPVGAGPCDAGKGINLSTRASCVCGGG